MAEQDALITALRASTPAVMESTNPGIRFFNPMAGMSTPTAGNPADLDPNSLYASSKFFDPADPFAAGAALTNRYGEAYAKETNEPLMDLSRYGGRYAQELSTPEGRMVFARDTGLANDNKRGFYGQGDFDPLTGLEDLSNPDVKKNYAALFDKGNSYFMPDAVEVDPYQYNYHMSWLGSDRTNEERDAGFERMYAGRNMVNNAAFRSGALSEGTENPEVLMRETLNAGAKSDPAVLAQALRRSGGVLAGMDVGRGSITAEQGRAIDTALQFQDNFDTLNRAANDRAQTIANLQNELATMRPDPLDMAGYNQRRASLEDRIKGETANMEIQRRNAATMQAQLDPYLATVRTISDPTALSSAEVIRLLRL